MPEQALQLPQEIQSGLDAACDSIIESTKKDYNNPLLPFEQYAKKVRLELNKGILNIFSSNQHAQAILKEYLEKEEKEHPDIPEDARWAIWGKTSQEIYKKLFDGTFNPFEKQNETSVQEQFGISWNFIDRVYNIAERLIDEGKYHDAASIFDLLIFFHPLVQDYWIRKAAALFGAEEFEAALEQCSFSLLVDPENPVVFFEIARCYFQLKEIDHCLASLDVCLKYCAKDEKHRDLMAEATTIRQAIESKKLTI